MNSTSLGPYTEYRASSIEWIEKLPSHWTSSTLGFECSVKARLGWKGLKADEYVESGYIFLSTPNIKWRHIDFDNVNFITKERYDESPEIMLEVGDVLVTKDGSTTGTTNLIRHLPSPATVNSSIAVIRSYGRIRSGYLYYFFTSEYVQHVINRMRDGMGVPHLFQADLRKFFISVPPLEEQTQIADFLDYETAKIDALIEKQQQLIALLKEKRQAVISHAVTKGLNPDVPMRDSGVEWLGEVPAHWKIKKLCYLGQLQNGLNISGDAFGSGDPFISYGDVYNNAIVPSKPSGLVRSTDDDQNKYGLKIGDVLFTRTSESIDDIGVASTCLQEIPKVTFAGFLIRFSPIPGNLDPNYSSFLFRNQSIQNSFIGSMNLVTRASLSQNVLKALPICLPPINEQVQIAAHLTKVALVYDQLERDLILQDELLVERRTALISAAVTGKIDVRNWKAPDSKLETEVA